MGAEAPRARDPVSRGPSAQTQPESAMAFGYILVTSDLSPAALRPCAPIATMARAMGSCVTLLHVIEDSPPARLSAHIEPADVSEDLQARMILARTQLELQSDTF